MRNRAHVGLAIAIASITASGGCLDVGAFACERADQCVLGENVGQCMDGYCAFADSDCESGLRYHGSAAADLAGVCVPVAPEPGSSDDPDATSGIGLDTEPLTTDEGSGDTLAVDASTSAGEPSCGDLPCACAVAIAAGDESTCALRDDGLVVCWGENDENQLGVIGKVAVSAWPLVVALPPGNPVLAIKSAHDHYCATMGDGTARCWGRNNEGMVVPELMPSDVAPPAVTDWIDGVTRIGLGSQLTCAAGADQMTVTCWGENGFGELGTLDTAVAPGPRAIGGPFGMQAVSEIVAGRDHACARLGDEVVCWGKHLNGQLGIGGTITDPNPVPQPVTLPAPAVRLVAGRNHTCAVLEPGDVVMCWGHNASGQVGAGTTSSKHATPAAIALGERRALDGPVMDARASVDGTCILTEPGTIWCWGTNGGNKLALGSDVVFTNVPVRLEVTEELSAPAVEIAVGDRHVCARTEDARVYCWGADDQEQLGPIDPAPGRKSVEIDLECEPK